MLSCEESVGTICRAVIQNLFRAGNLIILLIRYKHVLCFPPLLNAPQSIVYYTFLLFMFNEYVLFWELLQSIK